MRWRKKLGGDNGGGGSGQVYLNVYDLSPINGYSYWFGLGIFHSGVQVHGVEYAFGAHDFPVTGIFEGKPKKCRGSRFRKTISIGRTEMGPVEVKAFVEELSEKYRGDSYNLITKNCNHFSNDFCNKLTGNRIPSWVNRLARIGFLCNCVVPAKLKSTRVEHVGRDAKSEFEEHVKEAVGASASSSSSCVEICSGRRSRQWIPPISPSLRSSSSSSSSSSILRIEE